MIETEKILGERNKTENLSHKSAKSLYRIIGGTGMARNRINLSEAQRIVDELEENLKARDGKPAPDGPLSISMSEFVMMNLKRFQTFGLSKRSIYNFLTGYGLALGTFRSFEAAWRRAEEKQAPSQA